MRLALLPLSGLLAFSCGDKDPVDTNTGTEDDTGTGTGDDSGGTGGDDTADPGDVCATPVVTFKGADGSEKDVTEFFETGEYLTLALPGTLEFCPATWFARVLVRADVDVVGLGENPKDTILSGGESGTILDLAGPAVTMTVTNLRLDRGAGLDVDHNSGGGGIYCEQEGTVIGKDLIFTDNFANDGPAIYTRDCIVDLSGVVMKDNLAEDDGGAATFWFSTVTLDDVRIEDNVALDGGGIAMFNSTLTASNINIEGNVATNFAAGIWVYDSIVDITDATITNNQNPDSEFGGGILFYGSGSLTRVDFTDNSAKNGGGLFVYYEADLEVEDCDFSGNTDDDIWVADYSTAGGYTMDGGSGLSFSCASNVCE